MKWYFKVLRQYADFSGRARREEYWMFVLFSGIFAVVPVVLDLIVFEGGYVFSVLYFLALLIPSIAVEVRRLHDVGKSGWMMFILLIPLIGLIWLLVLKVSDSYLGASQYGENPLALLIPSIAVEVRRLHDVGKSGWMMFILLIPLIGLIWLLVLKVSDSYPGANQYGENPKKMTV